MIPLVGVSTYVAEASWGAWRRPAAVLPVSYYELVAAAGGRPLLLPPLSTAASSPGFGAEEVIDRLDGLVLTGGGDVDPATYGEKAAPEVGGVDPIRDASERALLAAALAVDMPVLAVCRGCQILNVERGGTLFQHLPDVVGHEGHRTAPATFGEVKVTTTPGSRTASIFGPAATVLCSHHQSIKELGAGLVATAHGDDGVIEAVELPGSSFVVGVQWHPEEGGDQRSFVALVEAARAFHARRWPA
jgi:putative glutamine amidotransferase